MAAEGQQESRSPSEPKKETTRSPSVGGVQFAWEDLVCLLSLGPKHVSSLIVSSAPEDNSTIGICGVLKVHVQNNGARNLPTTSFLITCAKM